MVNMISGRRGTGMRLCCEGLEWKLRAESADDFAEMVDVLIHRKSGHQYLDSGNDSVTVTVSIGEYPASLRPDISEVR